MGDSLFSELFHKKWVWALIVFDVLLLLVILGLNIFQAVKSARIEFLVTPLDATITMNGHEYQNGTYAILPGHYNVTISHPELDSKSFEFDLEPNYYLTFAVFLKHGDDFSFYTRKENMVSFWRLDTIGASSHNTTIDNDTSAEKFIDETNELYESLDLLPIEYQKYLETVDGRDLTMDITIKESQDEECETFLCIDAFIVGSDTESAAQELLEEKGFNLEDYEIHYKIY